MMLLKKVHTSTQAAELKRFDLTILTYQYLFTHSSKNDRPRPSQPPMTGRTIVELVGIYLNSKVLEETW